jgi:hypothetical protein
MVTLRQLLRSDPPDMSEVAAHLDRLNARERVAEIRRLRRKDQARLFDAARDRKPISLADIVDGERPAMQEVVHHGKNSLPFFNRFAKVFIRPPGGGAELWGYNRAGSFIETVVGPGYFVARPAEISGEVLVDYFRVPAERPEHWPPILPNSARLSRFVYYRTQDILRGVSEHVTIGRAIKAGKPMSAWFVLCRDDES